MAFPILMKVGLQSACSRTPLLSLARSLAFSAFYAGAVLKHDVYFIKRKMMRNSNTVDIEFLNDVAYHLKMQRFFRNHTILSRYFPSVACNFGGFMVQ